MSTGRRVLRVPGDAAGARLDRFLAGQLTELTRSALGRLIRAGQVSLDGVPASKPGQTLREGMQVEIVLPDAPSLTAQPESIPLDVVFEDDDLIVVDKPAGMVVHPGHGCHSGTLVHALLGRGTPLAPAGGAVRPGIVHRLDRGTSGLILVAKTDPAFHELRRAFSEREVSKRYVALVWGHPDPAEGTIERGIGRSRNQPVKMAVQHTRGRLRPAVSEYRTREHLTGFCLLEVRPLTGRTHQIRVHMQSIHHSLVGDDRYGGRAWRGVQDPLKRKALREFERLGLHASRLVLNHPVRGRPLRFKAALPPAFERLLEVLRQP